MVNRGILNIGNQFTRYTRCKILLDVRMPKVKDADIKKLFITKREFVSALKKVSQHTENPKYPPRGEYGKHYFPIQSNKSY